MTLALLTWAMQQQPVKTFRLGTDAAKTTHWKQVDRRRIQWQTAFIRPVQRVFRAEAHAVAEAVRTAAGPSSAEARAMRAINASDRRWQTLYQTLYLTVGHDFAMSVWRSLGVKVTVLGQTKDRVETVWAHAVGHYIDTVGVERVQGITATTKQKIRAVLREGLDAGDTLAEVAEAITEAYGVMADYRAERIARTEVLTASNYGGQEAARATGIPLVKEWISTRDDRTRGQVATDEFDHYGMDTQQRALNDPYDVSGEPMLCPGDSSLGASAGNIINCRCVEGYSPAD